MAQQKFCPSATEDRPKCEADLLQYKCGVFFLDLPEREHLSWIGGLPDIFKKRVIKVHIFWEGNKILQNLHLTFVLCSASQK